MDYIFNLFRKNGRGYSIDDAWKLASVEGGSHSVCDVEGGGYAVPVERSREIRPPSKLLPVLAHMPEGTVWLLPGPSWRIVRCRYCVDGCPDSYEINDRGQCAVCLDTHVHPPDDDPCADLRNEPLCWKCDQREVVSIGRACKTGECLHCDECGHSWFPGQLDASSHSYRRYLRQKEG